MSNKLRGPIRSAMFQHQTKLLVVLVVVGFKTASKTNSLVDVSVFETRPSDSRYWLSYSP